MEKYKKKFASKIRDQIDTIKTMNKSVPEKEIYQLLHTIKGTAGTVGYHDVGEQAEAVLTQFDEESEKTFSNDYTVKVLEGIVEGMDEVDSTERKELTDEKEVVILIHPTPMTLIEMKSYIEKQGFIVFASLKLSKARTVIYDMNPDCIILEHSLMEQDKDIADEIREKAEVQFIPLVITDGESSATNRFNSYKLGASDYFERDISKEEYIIRVLDKVKKRRLVMTSVLTDELTGAYNRKFLEKHLNHLRSEIVRTNEKVCITILDIDHFKSVNDQYGHLIGDQVLRKLSHFIMSQKKRRDTLIRYGGEEFVLVLPGRSSSNAIAFVNELLHDFQKEVFGPQTERFSVTFSAGIVELDTNSTNRELLNLADEALYRAKSNGRNQVIFYDNVQSSEKNIKTIQIAIVDDDEILRTMLTSNLMDLHMDGNYHIEVKAYREGEAFFEDSWHRTSSPCLVLLDGIMPRMDGIEVLHRLRHEREQSRYTVMMLTGRKTERDIVKALELGADDYITKPFNMLELEARIRRLIEKVV
ncbi:diguanylate cyclase [Alkalihalobacillus sp. R86527]|uniref:diguanylate cyclase n=1 Tax=Alkalihalobacillus sp. R86527 TaxID=3093863 RepID=UPI00366E2995